jgi:hypothetical protein
MLAKKVYSVEQTSDAVEKLVFDDDVDSRAIKNVFPWRGDCLTG